jgi:hypothetical protein
MNGESQQTPGM